MTLSNIIEYVMNIIIRKGQCLNLFSWNTSSLISMVHGGKRKLMVDCAIEIWFVQSSFSQEILTSKYRTSR